LGNVWIRRGRIWRGLGLDFKSVFWEGLIMSKQSDKLSKMYDDMTKRARRVAAYVVMRGAEHVGTIRMHYPADGMGRLVVYVADWTLDCPEHVPFNEFTRWQRGAASGTGYDKSSAAMSGMTIANITTVDDGYGWQHHFRAGGLTILQAI